MSSLSENRFLISRRIVQSTLLFLFAASNYWGLKILQGNYSTALVLDAFYLSDPHAVLQMLFAGFVAGTDVLIGGLIVLLSYAFIAGRAFCSWICPINIVSDLALYLRNRMDINTEVLKYNNVARYYILGLGLILSALFSTSAFELINPITIVQRGVIFGLGSGASVAFLILFFGLIVNKKAWCGSLCPLGAFYSLVSRNNLIKVFHWKNNCTDCGICFEVCPEKQVLDEIIYKKESFIFSGECSNCGRCVEKCNDNALSFRINKLKSK